MRSFLDFRIRVHKGDSGSRWSKGVRHIVQWVIKMVGAVPQVDSSHDTIGTLLRLDFLPYQGSSLITLPITPSNYALRLMLGVINDCNWSYHLQRIEAKLTSANPAQRGALNQSDAPGLHT